MSIPNPLETAIGFGVVAIAVGFGLYASQPGELRASEGQYTVSALFRSADGLVVGTDVRVAGVKVGRVSDMSLDPGTHRAKVDLTIDESVELSETTIAKIDSEGILGGVFVDLESDGVGLMLGEGDEIEFTQGSLSFSDLILKLGGGSGGCGEQSE